MTDEMDQQNGAAETFNEYASGYIDSRDQRADDDSNGSPAVTCCE